MRVLVVTSSPPFIEGGHLVIARDLVAALPGRRPPGRSRRDAAEPLRPPGRRLPRRLAHRRRRLGRRRPGRSGDQPALSGLRRSPSAAHLLAEPHHAGVLRSVAALQRVAVVEERDQGVDAPLARASGRPPLPPPRRRAPLRDLADGAGAAGAVGRDRCRRAASAGAGPAVPVRRLRRLHLRRVAADGRSSASTCCSRPSRSRRRRAFAP